MNLRFEPHGHYCAEGRVDRAQNYNGEKYLMMNRGMNLPCGLGFVILPPLPK